jgi:hypothetical protein
MSKLSNLFNKSTSTTTTGSVYQHLQQGALVSYYCNVVLTRLIKSSLSSLNNKEIFKELYQDNLIVFLITLIESGSLKCYVYKDKKGICKRISSTSLKDVLKNYTEIEIDITNANTLLFNQIKSVSYILANLLEVSLQNSDLSTKIIFKGEGLRTRISSDQSSVIADLVAITTTDNNVLVLDSKDILENGIPSNSNKTMLKDNFELATSTLSATTGFPMSFFNGDFGGGIASTNNIENTRLFEAKEQFFYTYLYEFFRFIGVEIEPKMTLSDRYSLNEIQSFLLSFEDKINVDETLLNLGFTLNDKSTKNT